MPPVQPARRSVADVSPEPVTEASGPDRGAWVQAGEGPTSVVLLVRDPSTLDVALSARELLAADRVEASVVRIESSERFARQAVEVRDEILPPAVPLVELAGLTAQAAVADAHRQLRRR